MLTGRSPDAHRSHTGPRVRAQGVPRAPSRAARRETARRAPPPASGRSSSLSASAGRTVHQHADLRGSAARRIVRLRGRRRPVTPSISGPDSRYAASAAGIGSCAPSSAESTRSVASCARAGIMLSRNALRYRPLIIGDKSPPRRARADAVRRKADHAIGPSRSARDDAAQPVRPTPRSPARSRCTARSRRAEGATARTPDAGRRRREDDVGLRGRDGFDGSLKVVSPGVVALVPHEQAAVSPESFA